MQSRLTSVSLDDHIRAAEKKFYSGLWTGLIAGLIFGVAAAEWFLT